MALTNYVPIRRNLARDRIIWRIARACKITPVHAVGCLAVIWGLADEYGDEQGNDAVLDWTFAELDAEVGVPGFTAAMATVGWLAEIDGGSRFIRYASKAGALEKKRMDAARRQARSRQRRDTCHTEAQQMSHPECDKVTVAPLPHQPTNQPTSQPTNQPTPPIGGGGGVQCDFIEDYNTGYTQPKQIIRTMLSIAGVVSDRVRTRISKTDGVTPAIVHEAIQHAATNKGGPGMIVSLLDNDLGDMRRKAEKRAASSQARGRASEAETVCQELGWESTTEMKQGIGELRALPGEMGYNPAKSYTKAEAGKLLRAWDRKQADRRKAERVKIAATKAQQNATGGPGSRATAKARAPPTTDTPETLTGDSTESEK